MPTFNLELTLEADDVERMGRVCKLIGREDWNHAVSWMVSEKLRELDVDKARIHIVCGRGRPMNRSQCGFCARNPKAVATPKERQRFSGFCSSFREKK